jgi:hypothetical protein
MRAFYCGFLTLLSLVHLTSCGSVPAGRAAKFAAIDEAPFLDPSFKPGAAILYGFDQPDTRNTWEADDWMLLGVKVSRGTESDVWFVRLSTLCEPSARESGPVFEGDREFAVPFGVGSVKTGTKFHARPCKVLIELYDRDGQFMRSSVRIVPQYRPTATLLDVWNMLHNQAGHRGAAEDAGEGTDAGGTAGLMAMLHTLGSARSLRPIRDVVRQDVIKPPSIIGLLLAGLKLNLQADVSDCEVVTSPWSTDAELSPRQMARFPVAIDGQKLFDCRLIVGPPNPPYQLTAGVLMFEAVHPQKSDHRFTLRVLAAKRIAADRRRELVASRDH